MEGCEWCVEGKCRVGDESQCDFKNLKKTKEDMRKRIDEEFEAVDGLIKGIKEAGSQEEANKKILEAKDKIQGIGIIRNELMEKFNDNYFPKGRMAFAKTLLSVNKYMRKFK